MPLRPHPQVGRDEQSRELISLKRSAGAYLGPRSSMVPSHGFVIDSGASDVSVPADVVMTLMRAGPSYRDFLVLNLCSRGRIRVPSRTFRIRSLKVGSSIVQGVVGVSHQLRQLAFKSVSVLVDR